MMAHYTNYKLNNIENGIKDVEKSIPSKTSDLTNDSGYLTEHQSLAAYSTTTEVQSMIDTAIAGITDAEEGRY